MNGRAVWYKRIGLRRFEVGIEFIDVKKAVASALEYAAEFGFLGIGGGSAPPFLGKAAPAPIKIPEHYETLGVTPLAGEDEIRHAFRLLARELHPDVSQDPQAAERFSRVQRAYAVLKDPQTRMEYDLRESSA